jgi:hypothetical protein
MLRPSPIVSRRTAFRRTPLAVALALTASVSLFADTPARLRNVSAGSCYCCCSESRTKGGCVKMCELPKYASRWWATTCAKPHMQEPADNSNAGPHLHHPDHAEHAHNLLAN